MHPAAFGKYQVVELIGEGGFGRVFKGMDPDLKRPVAIKTCSLSEPEMRERFFKEAEISAKLHHPNITTVYDFGREEGEPYLVQEYLTGEDLDDLTEGGAEIPLPTKIDYLIQVGEGLGHAHKHGVIHRDVKPANIRILDDGQVRIMDFGIARLVEETQRFTQAGMTIGTAGYLSPEQLQGLDVDHRSDIFSFGILAYELILNQAPFEGESISALFYSIAHEDPAPIREAWPDCPSALALCISRCLEKDPDARYRDFSEVTRDLRHALAALEERAEKPAPAPGGVPVPGDGDTAQRVGKGRKWLIPLWLTLGVALIIALFEVARFPRWGESSSPGEEQGTSEASDTTQGTRDTVPVVSSEEKEGADSVEGVAGDVAPISSGEEPEEDTPVQDPVAGREGEAPRGETTGREEAPPETEAVEAPAATEEAEAPYRGSSTLVLFWSEGGDPGSVGTAENAFLQELERRRLQVVDAGLLAGIHGDAAALAMAQGLDSRAIAELGREYNAEVVVVGSLRTEAAPSAGRFFTGRAILDARTYSVSRVELLGSASYQVGAGNTPGELGPSPLAAETEAAKEVGRRAAAEIARAFGDALPKGG